MKRYFAAKIADLAAASKTILEINGIEVGLFHVNGQWKAWRNYCPHMAAPVCKGKVCGTTLPSLVYEYDYGREGQILRCPWHGWEFDLNSGRHLVDPNVRLRNYKVEVENDDLYVYLPG
ncbi:MAG: (2Fe-2S)-binding protein [Paenibacillus sp.]|jgi:nitrite reductase/ring-hydroxylating ferredoxin subunit|nr:(2Fe-2S)-binding protein [Paenibacillus sp.]